MRVLDLFCGGGGASAGYARAGFDVVGVDIVPQPHYPFRFVQADALAPPFDLSDFDLIHASPPCQAWTAYKRRPNHVAPRPELIAPVREMVRASGVPWVIENVPGAPVHGVTLCGSMFGLDVRRHRVFETDPPILLTPPCDHGSQAPRFPQATNRANPRRTVEVGVWRIPLATQLEALGVDWELTREELSEAIPPAYTEWIGSRLALEPHP
jgi:DNA (cytosine-5)-methyltransferase 1